MGRIAVSLASTACFYKSALAVAATFTDATGTYPVDQSAGQLRTCKSAQFTSACAHDTMGL